MSYKKDQKSNILSNENSYDLHLMVQSCKLYSNKYMIASVEATNI